MNREDLLNMAFFTIVPPLALLLFALCIVAMALLPKGRRRGFIVSAAVFTSVGLVGAFITALMWGVGFHYADSYRPVPEATDRAMIIGFFVACASYAGILATGVLAAVTRRRSQVAAPRFAR